MLNETVEKVRSTELRKKTQKKISVYKRTHTGEREIEKKEGKERKKKQTHRETASAFICIVSNCAYATYTSIDA